MQSVPHLLDGHFPLLSVAEVPLVEENHDRAARRVDPLGEALVLMGDPLGGVDDQQRDVSPVDRPERADQRVVLGSLVYPGLAPHTGRVDEPDRAVVGVDHRIDGVPGRPRLVVDHRTVLAGQPVEQRRLADVGSSDQRHADDSLAWRIRLTGGLTVVMRVRQQIDQPVQEVAGAAAVQGTDRERLTEPQTQQLPDDRLMGSVVHLVGHHQDRFVASAQQGRHPVVVVGQPDGGVDH